MRKRSKNAVPSRSNSGFTLLEMIVGATILSGVVVTAIQGWQTFRKTSGGIEGRSAARTQLRMILQLLRNDIEARNLGPTNTVLIPGPSAAWTSGCSDLTVKTTNKAGPVDRVWRTTCVSRANTPASPATADGMNANCLGAGRAAQVSVAGGRNATYPQDPLLGSVSLCLRLIPTPADPDELVAEASALMRNEGSWRRIVERAVIPVRGDRSPKLQLVTQ